MKRNFFIFCASFLLLFLSFNNVFADSSDPKQFIQEIVDKAKEILVNPGTLILFYGRNYLHRVTPVKSKKNRILVTLNYNTEKGIKLSENARMTFFGRLN